MEELRCPKCNALLRQRQDYWEAAEDIDRFTWGRFWRVRKCRRCGFESRWEERDDGTEELWEGHRF